MDRDGAYHSQGSQEERCHHHADRVESRYYRRFSGPFLPRCADLYGGANDGLPCCADRRQEHCRRKTGAQTQTKSGSKLGSKPASGGRYYGGVNTVNTFADSRRSEQQSGSSPRQTEPRASGTEPAAQLASAAADRSFVMPGTRRPVSHVPGEQKIAPSDTAGKAGHTVSRSSHVQAGGQQHTASAARQHTATSAFESRYSRNTGPARPTVVGKPRVRLPRLPMLRPRHRAPVRYRRNGVLPPLLCPPVSAAGVVPIPQE